MLNNGPAWNPWALGVALFVMIGIAVLSHYVKGKLSTLPFLLGILGGYIVAASITGIGYAVNVDSMKLVDFSIFKNMQ